MATITKVRRRVQLTSGCRKLLAYGVLATVLIAVVHFTKNRMPLSNGSRASSEVIAREKQSDYKRTPPLPDAESAKKEFYTDSGKSLAWWAQKRLRPSRDSQNVQQDSAAPERSGEPRKEEVPTLQSNAGQLSQIVHSFRGSGASHDEGFPLTKDSGDSPQEGVRLTKDSDASPKKDSRDSDQETPESSVR